MVRKNLYFSFDKVSEKSQKYLTKSFNQKQKENILLKTNQNFCRFNSVLASVAPII